MPSSPAQPTRTQDVSHARRRLWLLLGLCGAVDVALAAVWLSGAGARLADGIDRLGPAAAVALLFGLPFALLAPLAVLARPYQRREAERQIAAYARGDRAPWWQQAAVGVGLLVLLVAAGGVVQPHHWRTAAARAAGLAAYFVVYIPLGRLQRLGVPPYLRPRWYGFPLAGVVGGAVWAAAAGEPLRAGVAAGVTWSLLHYALVRWGMRGVRAPAV